MTVSFSPAVRRNVPLWIGLTGPAGSGKTYSALRLAAGIAGDGAFFGIDTETGRMLHYAEDFRFMHGELSAPFSGPRYLEAIKAAEAAGARAIAVDSMSHEWNGAGGTLAYQEEELARMAGDDWRKREQMKMASWIKPKLRHQAFLTGLLTVRVPLIFAFRGKRPTVMAKNPSTGKMEVSEGPFRAITSEEFPYEMTALLVLSEMKPGAVDLNEANKISKPIRPFMRDGELLDERFGAALAAWARGETAARQAAEPLRTRDAAAGQAAKPKGLRAAIVELEAALRGAISADEYREIVGTEETRRIRSAALERLPDEGAKLEELLAELGSRWFAGASGENGNG